MKYSTKINDFVCVCVCVSITKCRLCSIMGRAWIEEQIFKDFFFLVVLLQIINPNSYLLRNEGGREGKREVEKKKWRD